MLAWATLLAALLPARPLEAHTYTAVADDALARRADLIVRGTVAGVDPRAGNRGGPLTHYRITVVETLKGRVRGELTVTIRGGESPDGRRLVVSAEPRLATGDEVLLFLRDDARVGPLLLEFQLGAFRVDRSGARPVARRDIPAPLQLDAASDGGRSNNWRAPRDLQKFERWIRRQLIAPYPVPADYFVEQRPGFATLPYSLFSAGGRSMRWLDVSPGYRAGGTLDGDSSGGLPSAQTAAGAWNSSSLLAIGVAAGGAGSNGFNSSDGINSILFEDPADEISGSFDCATGGTLAIGGTWYAGNTFTVEGESFVEILEGDIVVQDGLSCLIAATSGVPQELLAHELGHTIGIGHSAVGQALMWPSIHADGRGASLHADDIAARAALRYASAGGGGGGGDPGGGDDPDGGDPDPDPVDPDVPLEPPAAPRNLVVASNCGSLVLQWDAPIGGGPLETYVVEIGTRPGASDVLVNTTTDSDMLLTQARTGTFYVRVRGRNADADGPASDEGSYFIEGAGAGPARIEVTRPRRRSSLALPELQWQHTCGVSSYQVHAFEGDSMVFDRSFVANSYCGVLGNCTVTANAESPGPFRGGLAQWWIRGRNASGWGPWTETTFRVQRQRKPRRPKLTSPRDNAVINGRIRLQWKSDETTNVFSLRLLQRGTGQVTEYPLNAVTVCSDPLTCSYQFADLPSGTWTWWVVPGRDFRTLGKTSRRRSFQTQ